MAHGAPRRARRPRRALAPLRRDVARPQAHRAAAERRVRRHRAKKRRRPARRARAALAMCGIAALFAPRAEPLGPLIGAMTDLIRYRGPDDEGVVLFDATPQRAALALGGADSPSGVYQKEFAFCPSRVRNGSDGASCIAALGNRRL